MIDDWRISIHSFSLMLRGSLSLVENFKWIKCFGIEFAGKKVYFNLIGFSTERNIKENSRKALKI